MPEPSNRRAMILDKAAQLFAAKGVRATTVREIGDNVGMLSGSLYHHFGSKDAIVDELLRSYLEDLRARYHEVARQDLDPRARIERLIEVSMEVVEAHPYTTEIYQNDFNLLRDQPGFGYLKTSAADTRRVWLDALKSGVEAGVFRDDIEPSVLYRIIRDLVWLGVRWQRPGPSRLKLAQQCASVLLDGISAPEPVRRRPRTP
jgi:AcrR family transcriptional regulator